MRPNRLLHNPTIPKGTSLDRGKSTRDKHAATAHGAPPETVSFPPTLGVCRAHCCCLLPPSLPPPVWLPPFLFLLFPSPPSPVVVRRSERNAMMPDGEKKRTGGDGGGGKNKDGREEKENGTLCILARLLLLVLLPSFPEKAQFEGKRLFSLKEGVFTLTQHSEREREKLL